jgi:predicted ATPase
MKIFVNKKPEKSKNSYLYLKYIDWDDYSYKSTFELYYCKGSNERNIGEIKIIDADIDVGYVKFDSGLNKLPSNFCSLGQTEDYYRNIKKLNERVYIKVLESLNDCSFDESTYALFKDLPQFKSSAVRFSQAEQALKFGRTIFARSITQNVKPCHSFTFDTKLKGFDSNHKLNFNFFSKDDKAIPSNINVIIGRNGTGKTQLLSDLAKTISGYGFDSKEELIASRDTKFGDSSPSFGPVIVISYSAFDNFELPGKDEQERSKLQTLGHVHGYKYCGLRDRIEGGQYRLKDIDEVTNEFTQSCDKIDVSEHSEEWHSCIEHVLNDPSFRGIKNKSLHKNFIKLSSGQKIILSILAGVFEHIKTNSIVIIDEPETHLHPSLMSAFMHSIRAILELFDSYAIIATHSPVILQETPSMFVQVLSGGLKKPMVKHLTGECFGEEISTLTEDVFRVSFEESNFYNVLSELSKKGYSVAEIERLFEKRLGFTARSFIETL